MVKQRKKLRTSYLAMKWIASLSFFLLLPLYTSCDREKGNSTHSSPSQLAREQRELDPFNSILFEGRGLLKIKESDRFLLEISSQEDLLQSIESTVSNGQLTIGLRRSGFFQEETEPVRLYLEVPSLSSITVHGAGIVFSESVIETDSFTLVLRGSSDVRLRILAKELNCEIQGASNVHLIGEVDTQRVTITGCGDYFAQDLQSKEAIIQVDGSGSANITVHDLLEASVSGLGRVTYVGECTLKQTVSGLGRVTKLKEFLQ